MKEFNSQAEADLTPALRIIFPSSLKDLLHRCEREAKFYT
jgi:hypothetical protein